MRPIPEPVRASVRRSRSLSGAMSSLPDEVESDEGKKVVVHFDSKDLILQFNNLNVTNKTTYPKTFHPRKPQRHSSLQSLPGTRTTSSSNAISTAKQTSNKVVKNWRFKAKSEPRSSSSKVVLRPSRLNLMKPDSESLFQNFSVACSKELESIARLTQTKFRSSSARPILNTSKVQASPSNKKGPARQSAVASLPPNQQHQKRRKASSCAQQVREVESQVDELSEAIDILADYLEESVVFPKKMSYMAELMYT